MQWIPHNYQQEAIKLLVSKPQAGLFAEMGTGKTATTLTALKILKDKNLMRRALIVAPLRVAKFTWGDEIAKWDHLSGLSYSVIHGTEKNEIRHEATDIHLINPEGLLWLLPLLEQQKQFPYDVLVIDESSKFKSWTSQRFKKLKKLLGKFSRRYILTGTPATNGMMDIFAQMYIVDMGLSLGAYITAFRNTFFEQKPWDQWNWYLKNGAEEEIYKRIQHKIMRVTAGDYLDMPDMIVQDLWVDLPLPALKQYAVMENTLMLQLQSGQISASNAAVASGKCRQIASGFVYADDGTATVLHEAKFEALDDLLESLQGEPVLLFYNFKATEAELKKRYKCPFLGGTVNEAQRQVLNDWNEGKIPLLAGHPASMSHGLNMQDGGRHIVWFDPTWDLEHYLQANARLFRQGQKNTVFIHRLLARGTLEKAVVARLSQKDDMQNDLLQALRDYWNNA